MAHVPRSNANMQHGQLRTVSKALGEGKAGNAIGRPGPGASRVVQEGLPKVTREGKGIPKTLRWLGA